MFHSVSALLEKVKAYFYTEVPADMAVCEFDCREIDCQLQDWQDCTKRLQGVETPGKQPERSPGHSPERKRQE